MSEAGFKSRTLQSHVARVEGISIVTYRKMNGAVSPESRIELGSTGIEVSPIGFGAAPLGNEFGHVLVSAAASMVFRGAFTLCAILLLDLYILLKTNKWSLHVELSF